MKIILSLIIGAVLGVVATRYVDEPKFAKEANTYLDSGVAAASSAAHKGLQSAEQSAQNTSK